jgi:hypothetical protein
MKKKCKKCGHLEINGTSMGDPLPYTCEKYGDPKPKGEKCKKWKPMNMKSNKNKAYCYIHNLI